MKKAVTYSLLFWCVLSIQAQQLPLQNQYYLNPIALSPSFTGHNNNFEVFAGYRNSWLGVDGAPETRSININGRLMENMGIGGEVVNDRIGVFNSFSATANYAYHLQVSHDQMLRFGLAAGVFENTIDITGNGNNDIQDPIIMNNQNVRGVTGHAVFGLSYTYRKLHAGLVLPNLFPGKVNNDNQQQLYSLKNHFVFHAHYQYALKSNLEVVPYLLLRKSAASPLLYELAAQVKYQKKLWLGLNYRKNTVIGVSVGGMLANKLAMNYTYEFLGGNNVMGYSSGTHEISLGFLLGDKPNTTSSVFNAEKATSKKRPYLQWMQ